MSGDRDRILSVFELANGLKRTVENATAGRWVEGEIGRLQRPASGHMYFTLKDESRDAAVDCVMYKRDATRFAKHLTEGGRVQLRGRASFYPPRGRLQWIAEVARPAGQGALLEALEKLKQKIVLEGLTDPERRRPLPSHPRVVGVITSRTGAAFSDIRTVAQRRGRVRLLLAHAVVQGEQSPESLLRAMDLLECAKPDVVIIGRGGGSAEDLMAFNDERVVRRVADYSIPIVSAVGHEVDMALTDLVADARAATPSQAAELVVADEGERREALARVRRHLSRTMIAVITEQRLALDRWKNQLGDPRFVVANEQQALDDLRMRMSDSLRLRVAREKSELSEANRRLYARHPRTVLANARTQLSPMNTRLVAAMRRKLDAEHAGLRETGRSLSALSPLSILGRGFALATDENGSAIRDAAALTPGERVSVRVRKGTFLASVEKVVSSVENHSGFDHETPSPGGEGENFS